MKKKGIGGTESGFRLCYLSMQNPQESTPFQIRISAPPNFIFYFFFLNFTNILQKNVNSLEMGQRQKKTGKSQVLRRVI